MPIRGPPPVGRSQLCPYLGRDELNLELIEDDVPLVYGVLEGALGAFGDGGCSVGDGVLASYLVRSMNNFLGGIIEIFGFLESFEVEV
ncbi:hypothetical protein Tco_1396050 [Tanacetum coccineum]